VISIKSAEHLFPSTTFPQEAEVACRPEKTTGNVIAILFKNSHRWYGLSFCGFEFNLVLATEVNGFFSCVFAKR